MTKFKADVIDNCYPDVYFTNECDQKIRAMLKHHDKEVMWKLLVKKIDANTFEVYNIYYPPQSKMDGAFCELEEEADTRMFWYLKYNKKQDEWENVKGVAHSHVNMGASFSGIDTKFMKDNLQTNCGSDPGNQFWLVCVFNKKMDNEIILFDMDRRVKFTCPYVVKMTNQENSTLSAKAAVLVEEIMKKDNLNFFEKKDKINKVFDVVRADSKIDRVIKGLAEKRTKAIEPYNRFTNTNGVNNPNRFGFSDYWSGYGGYDNYRNDANNNLPYKKKGKKEKESLGVGGHFYPATKRDNAFGGTLEDVYEETYTERLIKHNPDDGPEDGYFDEYTVDQLVEHLDDMYHIEYQSVPEWWKDPEEKVFKYLEESLDVDMGDEEIRQEIREEMISRGAKPTITGCLEGVQGHLPF